MTPEARSQLQKLVKDMRKWDDWWFWDTMRNWQEVVSIRVEIKRWAKKLETIASEG